MVMVALTAMTQSSCSMMTEDLAECVTTVSVVFKYDYNIERADMFHDHVGSVRLFVVDDATNQVVKDTTVSNRDDLDAIRQNDGRYYTMQLSGITPDRSYRFVAYALQRPYDETARMGSDRFEGTFPQLHADVTTLGMSLTHGATPDSEGRHAVTAPTCGLDTLWMGHTTKPFFVPFSPNRHQNIADTISMVRDTKYLQVLLHQSKDPADLYADDYEVEIVAANANLAWNNTVLDSPTLLYTPHFSRTVESYGLDADQKEVVTARTPYYEISFSRLMCYEGTDFPKNAKLHLIRKAKGTEPREVIAVLNLPHSLAMGRTQYAWYHYSEQEYLDREYNYRLDFYILGGKVEDVFLTSVNITPWSIRLQNEKL